MAIILSNLNRFKKKITGIFFNKFVVNWLLKNPPLLAYVATLPCETLMSENKRLTINYKSEKSYVYLGCDGFLNNQIKKGLLLSPSVIYF